MTPPPTGPPDHWPADVLDAYTTAERLARVDRVLRHRLGSIAVVCEDVFDPHNVAACVRTAEAMGIQDIHWVLNQHHLRMHSTVAKSADQWTDFRLHAGTAAAVEALRAAGFALWVSDLQADGALADLELPPKLAIVIGNAKRGVSEAMRAAADRRFLLPMYGMVQSYNLSVALALTLGEIVPRRRAQLAHDGQTGDLDRDRLIALRRRWLEFGQPRADLVRRILEGGDGD